MPPKRLCPYVVQERPGRVAWCACGESAKDPYCDGSHARLKTGAAPLVVDVPKAGKVAWCGCKQAASRPYCNGTHARLLLGGAPHFEALSPWRAKGCHSAH